MGKNAISMFLAEVLYKTLQEDAEDLSLFDWCHAQICLLDAMEEDFANFHLRFLLDYCSALGFAPTRESLLPFTEDLTMPAHSMLSRTLSQAMLLPMNGKERVQLCQRLLRYLSFHLERAVNVRSLDVLSELF